MKRFRTKGIVLRRVDYGEGDRIVTFLTPDNGTIGVMAKGVRKPNSKLAGGIELFSECDITLIGGRGELYTLVSSRLDTYFKNIVSNLERVELAYEAINQINKIARHDDTRLYGLLLAIFQALDDTKLALVLVELWFRLNLLAVLGQQPDLLEDSSGQKLASDVRYELDPAEGVLHAQENGALNTDHIKTWRLMLGTSPDKAAKINGVETAAEQSIEAVRQLFAYQTT